MGKLVLGDGGDYHRPGRPDVFGPGLRAAAHYLQAVEEVEPEVLQELRREVVAPHWSSDYLRDRLGLRLSRKSTGLEVVRSQPVEPQRRRYLRALPFLKAFQAWMNKYYMWSASLGELLDKTLRLWADLHRELDEIETTFRDAHKYEATIPLTDRDRLFLEGLKPRMAFLTEELTGWGWWVDFLASGVTIPELSAWLRDKTATRREHQRVLERWDGLRLPLGWGPGVPGPSFGRFLDDQLYWDSWTPEREVWAAFEQRLRTTFDNALKAYREEVEGNLRAGRLGRPPQDSAHVKWGAPHDWKPVPTKHGNDHFRWLALRQVKGLRPKQIADRHHVQVQTVREGLKTTAALIGLRLRPVASGRPPVLDEP